VLFPEVDFKLVPVSNDRSLEVLGVLGVVVSVVRSSGRKEKRIGEKGKRTRKRGVLAQGV